MSKIFIRHTLQLFIISFILRLIINNYDLLYTLLFPLIYMFFDHFSFLFQDESIENLKKLPNITYNEKGNREKSDSSRQSSDLISECKKIQEDKDFPQITN